jgi:hypothetical protein
MGARVRAGVSMWRLRGWQETVGGGGVWWGWVGVWLGGWVVGWWGGGVVGWCGGGVVG